MSHSPIVKSKPQDTHSSAVICAQPVVLEHPGAFTQFQEDSLRAAMRVVDESSDPSTWAIEVLMLRIRRIPSN